MTVFWAHLGATAAAEPIAMVTPAAAEAIIEYERRRLIVPLLPGAWRDFNLYGSPEGFPKLHWYQSRYLGDLLVLYFHVIYTNFIYIYIYIQTSEFYFN